MLRTPEHNEQAAFFRWTELLEKQYPALGRFFAVPNGGHRKKAVAGKLKAEGVRKGVPDVLNLTPRNIVGRGAYHGLVLEFKVGRNRLSAEQEDWCDYFDRNNYRVAVPRSWVEAALVAIEYFDLPESLKENLPAR